LRERLNSSYLKYAYVDQNLSQIQIAERVGCGTSSVVRALKRHGICKDKRTIYKQIDDHRRRTFKSRYGSEHYMQSKSGYARYRQSLKEHLGVTHNTQLPGVWERIIKTHRKRYGVAYSIQNPKSNRKRIATLNMRYGDYRKHLSKISALHYVATSPRVQTIRTRFGLFRVKSSLEAKAVKLLASLGDVHSLRYEPLQIECNEFFMVPDLLINKRLIIEIKYSKYISGKKPNNLDRMGVAMWLSCKRKLPALRRWCSKKRHSFGVMTERDLKHVTTLRQLIFNFQIFRDYGSIYRLNQRS